jgi:hypothetical protein
MQLIKTGKFSLYQCAQEDYLNKEEEEKTARQILLGCD